MQVRTALTAWLAALAVLALGAAAWGQGTQGHGIPDPITTNELLRYADRLVLSDEQRQALQPFHEEYREQFRRLREGEIDRYIEQMQATGRAMPGQDEWERARRDRDRILSQIKSIDEALFTNIESILTDEQREKVVRVRMARQRARALPAMQLMISRAQTVDLSDLVVDLDLTMSERKRIDPWLFDYERRLTRMVEELPGIVADAWAEFYRRSEEMQRAMEAQQDPAAAAEQARSMMTLMQESFGVPHEHTRAIRGMGAKAMFDIGAQINDAAAHELRNAFIRRSYMTASHYLRSAAESAFASLTKSERLNTDEREQVAELASQTRRRVEAIVREALEAIDEHEATTSMFSMDRDAMREHNERMVGFSARISEVDRQAVEQMLAFLSEEAKADIPQSLIMRAQAPATARGQATQSDAQSQAQYVRSTINAMLPQAISVAELAEIEEALDLNDDQRQAVRELHSSYAEEVTEAAGPLSHDAARRPHEGGEGAIEMALAAGEARQKAFAEIEKADNEFFNKLAAALPDLAADLERFRLARERRRYTGSRSFGMMRRMTSGSSATIDLAQVARSSRINLYASPESAAIMAEYDREVTRLLRDRYEGIVDLEEGRLHSVLRTIAGAERPDMFSEDAMERMRKWREMESRLDSIERSIAELTQQTVDDLGSVLATDESSKLLAGYREQAMPQVYADPGAMDSHVARALRMDDLTSSQRDRVAELAAEYRAAYSELTEQMREVYEKREEVQREIRASQWGGGPPRTSPEQRRLWEEFEKLRYERQELNSRTILALQGILNETQTSRLGPMPDPTRATMPWMGR